MLWNDGAEPCEIRLQIPPPGSHPGALLKGATPRRDNRSWHRDVDLRLEAFAGKNPPPDCGPPRRTPDRCPDATGSDGHVPAHVDGPKNRTNSPLTSRHRQQGKREDAVSLDLRPTAQREHLGSSRRRLRKASTKLVLRSTHSSLRTCHPR